MKCFDSLRTQWRAGAVVAAMALAAASLLSVSAADSTAAKEAKAAKPEKKKQKLTGAELYAINCNRCHPERYATERTAAQWKTLMLHMRVRANLPADQAKVVLKYLQEDSGK